MVDSRDDSEPSAPSEMLLKVKRCCGKLVAARFPSTPLATEGGAENAAVENIEEDCLISALREWHTAGGGTINELSDLFYLRPRFELGDATNDVFLYCLEIGCTVKARWKSAP
jgi:hypothetical protein